MLAHLLRKAGIVTHDVLAASEPDVIGDNMGITLCVCVLSINKYLDCVIQQQFCMQKRFWIAALPRSLALVKYGGRVIWVAT